MDTPLSLARYLDVLTGMAAYYLPLERRLEQHALPSDFDHASRRKTPAIRRDLAYFGLAEPSDATSLPELNTTAHALGALYVLEGSTLGGQVISRHLRAQLSLDAEHGAAFFNGYGTRTGPMWSAFCSALTAHAEDGTPVSEILDGAERTFVQLERWLTPAPELAHD